MTQEQLSRIEDDTASMRDVLAVRRRSAEAWRQHLAQQQSRNRRRVRWGGVLYVLRGVVAFAALACSVLGVTLLIGGAQW